MLFFWIAITVTTSKTMIKEKRKYGEKNTAKIKDNRKLSVLYFLFCISAPLISLYFSFCLILSFLQNTYFLSLLSLFHSLVITFPFLVSFIHISFLLSLFFLYILSLRSSQLSLLHFSSFQESILQKKFCLYSISLIFLNG